MSKDKFSDPDDDFDDEFDMGEFDMDGGDDFDMDSPEGGGDRSPASGLDKGYIAKSLVSGKTAKDLGSKIGKEYEKIGNATASTIDVASQLNMMKDDIVRDIAPTITQAKRVSKMYLPKVEKFLPKSLHEKLDKFLTPEEGYSGTSVEETRNASINASIQGIFAKQEEIQQERYVNDKTENVIKDQVEGKRHLESSTLLSQIRNINKVNQNFFHGEYRQYLMKSLELKYRHLFVAEDTRDFIKGLASVTEAKLTDVVKNTGLPDFVKRRQSEDVQAYMRERLIGKGYEKAGDILNNYKEKTLENVKTNFADVFTNGFNDLVGGISDLGEGVIEEEQMDAEMGIKTQGMGSKLITGLLRKALVDTELVGAKGLLGDRKFEDVNDMIGTAQGTAAFKLEELKEKYEGTAIGSLLTSLLPELNKGSATLDNTYVNNSTDEIQLDMAMRKAQVEIIPGLLSKILKDTNVISKVTTDSHLGKLKGDAKSKYLNELNGIEEQVFDEQSEDFMGVSEYRDRKMRSIFGTKEEHSDRMDGLINSFKAGYRVNTGSDDTSELDDILPELTNVLINLARNAKIVNITNIVKYLEGGELSDIEQDYLDIAFKDIPEDKREAVAKVIKTSFVRSMSTDENGKLSIEVNKDVATNVSAGSIDLYKRIDEHNEELVKLNTFGNKRHFKELRHTDTNNSLNARRTKVINEYTKKYGNKVNTDLDIKRKLEKELEDLKSSSGVNEGYVDSQLKNIDYDRLRDNTSGDDTYNTYYKNQAERDKELGEDALKRTKDAIVDDFKSKTKPIRKGINRVFGGKNSKDDIADKFNESDKLADADATTKEEADASTAETGIPNKDDTGVSSPGLYQQRAEHEVHLPVTKEQATLFERMKNSKDISTFFKIFSEEILPDRDSMDGVVNNEGPSVADKLRKGLRDMVPSITKLRSDAEDKLAEVKFDAEWKAKEARRDGERLLTNTRAKLTEDINSDAFKDNPLFIKMQEKLDKLEEFSKQKDYQLKVDEDKAEVNRSYDRNKELDDNSASRHEELMDWLVHKSSVDSDILNTLTAGNAITSMVPNPGLMKRGINKLLSLPRAGLRAGLRAKSAVMSRVGKIMNIVPSVMGLAKDAGKAILGKLYKTGGTALGIGMDVGKWGLNKQLDLLRGTKNLAVGGLKGLSDKFAGTDFAGKLPKFDLYLPGKDEPILRLSSLKKGEYFNKDGKVIKSIKDFADGVYDKDGNLIVSIKELTSGLTYPNGKKFKLDLSSGTSLLSGIGTGIGNLATGAGNLAGSMMTGVGNLYGSALSGMGKLGTGMLAKLGFSKDGEESSTGGKLFKSKLLTKVDKLITLTQGISDNQPKKIREGSLEDFKRDKLAARESASLPGGASGPRGKTGLGVSGLLGSIFSNKNKDTPEGLFGDDDDEDSEGFMSKTLGVAGTAAAGYGMSKYKSIKDKLLSKDPTDIEGAKDKVKPKQVEPKKVGGKLEGNKPKPKGKVAKAANTGIGKIKEMFTKVMAKLPSKMTKFFKMEPILKIVGKLGKSAIGKILARFLNPWVGLAITVATGTKGFYDGYKYANKIMKVDEDVELSLTDKLRVGTAGCISAILLGLIDTDTIAYFLDFDYARYSTPGLMPEMYDIVKDKEDKSKAQNAKPMEFGKGMGSIPNLPKPKAPVNTDSKGNSKSSLAQKNRRSRERLAKAKRNAGPAKKLSPKERAKWDAQMSGFDDSGTVNLDGKYNLALAQAVTKGYEGVSFSKYLDSVGKSTIGFGHLNTEGYDNVTPEEADALFQQDYQEAIDGAKRLSKGMNLNATQFTALTDMCFNLGEAGVSKFKGMLAGLREGDPDKVLFEAEDSVWWGQVYPRSAQIANALASGDPMKLNVNDIGVYRNGRAVDRIAQNRESIIKGKGVDYGSYGKSPQSKVSQSSEPSPQSNISKEAFKPPTSTSTGFSPTNVASKPSGNKPSRSAQPSTVNSSSPVVAKSSTSTPVSTTKSSSKPNNDSIGVKSALETIAKSQDAFMNKMITLIDKTNSPGDIKLNVNVDKSGEVTATVEDPNNNRAPREVPVPSSGSGVSFKRNKIA